MRILGVSCDFHDSAAAVVVGGEVVAAAEQERFSRRKHDASLPADAIASVLAIAGLAPDDLDAVAFHEKPLVTLTRVVAARQRRGPRGLSAFARELPVLLRDNVFVGLRIERVLRDLGARRRPTIRYAEHHLSHAAAAFYPSPFGSAAVLTIDGIGEWATGSIGRGLGGHVDLLAEQHYPDSLGLFYSLVTDYCGFTPNDGEYKLMGLAPYGAPAHLDALRSVVDVHADGSITVSDALTRWSEGSRPLERLLGRAKRQPSEPLLPFHADVARSAQVLVEDAVLAMARHAHDLTGERNLCMAGGVALNCVANGRLLREGPFDDVWVQPAAGDAGSAVGAALWLAHSEMGVERPAPAGDAMRGSLLGPAMEADAVAAWLDEARVPHRRVPDREERASEVAAALADGRVVGWFEGAMEFGPRALGHRSILADPRSPTAQRDLNVRVKGRESFRPFAPAVLEERADEWFDLDRPTRYMLFTADLAEAKRSGALVDPSGGAGLHAPAEVRSEIPACTHVDHSARVQTVAAERSDGFRAVLEAFDARTGCPVVLNTSFNAAGEPVVCTPDDAVATARRTGLDLLVLEDSIVAVPDLPEEVPAGSWDQVPVGRPEARPARGVGTAVAAAIVVALGPTLWMETFSVARGAGTAAAALVALGALRLLDDGRWWARLPVVGLAAAAAHPLGGNTLALWLGVALLAVDMVAWEHVPVPGVPRGDRQVLPGLVAISLVMAWLARTEPQATRFRPLIVVMALVVAVTAFLPGRLAGVAARFGTVVGGVVGYVGSWLLGLVTVVLPWVVHRIVRVDPLRPRGRPAGSSWLEREPAGTQPRELWRRDPVRSGIPLAIRLRRGLGALGVVGLFVAASVPVVQARREGWKAPLSAVTGIHQNTDPGEIPAAFEGEEEWFREYSDDIAWLWRTSVAWDPLAPVRLRDVKTRWVNIEDGARKTWRPPACDCRRLKVWFYGGSTAFGLGQRDEHTIASELARAAWKDGLALDVENRGVVGDHHWEEANRFAWDLASLPTPDMVIFLDGINDVQAVDRMRERTRQPLSFIKDDFWQNFLSVADEDTDSRWKPDDRGDERLEGASVPPTVPLTFGSPQEVGRFVASRYETARKISAAMAEQYGVTPEWFWQPAIENRPAIEGEPPPKGREWSLTRYKAAAAAVGDEVHDVSGALDGMDEPLYWDQFHTNEVGAARIGQVMYGVLEARLRELAGEPR